MDLEMPIINGYQACQNIINLYNNNKISNYIINTNKFEENKSINQ